MELIKSKHEKLNTDRILGIVNVQNLICHICKFILPLIGSESCKKCGKCFCEACSSKKNKIYGLCNICKKEYSPNDLPATIKEDLKHLMINCINEIRGCEEKILYIEIAQHEKSCLYKMMTCECSEEIIQIDYEIHLETCSANVEICSKCGYKSKKDNTVHECGKMTIIKSFKSFNVENKCELVYELLKNISNEVNQNNTLNNSDFNRNFLLLKDSYSKLEITVQANCPWLLSETQLDEFSFLSNDYKDNEKVQKIMNIELNLKELFMIENGDKSKTDLLICDFLIENWMKHFEINYNTYNLNKLCDLTDTLINELEKIYKYKQDNQEEFSEIKYKIQNIKNTNIYEIIFKLYLENEIIKESINHIFSKRQYIYNIPLFLFLLILSFKKFGKMSDSFINGLNEQESNVQFYRRTNIHITDENEFYEKFRHKYIKSTGYLKVSTSENSLNSIEIILSIPIREINNSKNPIIASLPNEKNENNGTYYLNNNSIFRIKKFQTKSNKKFIHLQFVSNGVDSEYDYIKYFNKTEINFSEILLSDKKIEKIAESILVNKTLNKIILSGCGMSYEGVGYLEKVLSKNKILEELHLNNNNVTDLGSKFVASIFRNNKSITKMNLFNCNIGSLGGQFISESLFSNKLISYLNLGCNHINDEGAISFSAMLRINKSLKEINIGSNNISDKGVVFIFESLTQNKTLSQIYLNNNLISDKGLEALAKLLKSNRTLSQISLGVNNVSDEGVVYLLEALTKNSIMKWINLCNNKITHVGAGKILNYIKINKKIIINF